MAEWIKELVDWYGHSSLVRFQTGAGEEFSGSNAFQTEKLAMALDGEWRTALIKSEAPKLQYGTAPMPVADNQSQLYGSGFTIGNITGIPEGLPPPRGGLGTDQVPGDRMSSRRSNSPKTWATSRPGSRRSNRRRRKRARSSRRS